MSKGIWLLLLFVAGGTSRFEYGHLASLRHTTTEAETHNERMCAHMVGDHTGHAYPFVCMCGMCIFKWGGFCLCLSHRDYSEAESSQIDSAKQSALSKDTKGFGRSMRRSIGGRLRPRRSEGWCKLTLVMWGSTGFENRKAGPKCYGSHWTLILSQNWHTSDYSCPEQSLIGKGNLNDDSFTHAISFLFKRLFLKLRS
jgi:hypothetical protein